MRASMDFRSVNGIMFILHNDQSVQSSEWNEMLDAISSSLEHHSDLKLLVKTLGGAPNSAQRAALNTLVEKHKVSLRVAVLSSSGMVRGVVKAFAWMNSFDIRSFGDGEMGPALKFLGVDANVSSCDEVLTVLRKNIA